MRARPFELEEGTQPLGPRSAGGGIKGRLQLFLSFTLARHAPVDLTDQGFRACKVHLSVHLFPVSTSFWLKSSFSV